MSSKDHDEQLVMHSKRDKMEIIINNKANEVIKKVSSITSLQVSNGLETSIKDSNFIFDCVYLLY